MAVDLDAAAVAIAAVITAAEIDVNGRFVVASDVFPEDFDPPFFAVAEYPTEYLKDYGDLSETNFTCRLFTGRNDDTEGQRTLRRTVGLVRTALMTDGRGAPGEAALGGLAQDLVVRRISAPRLYQIGEAWVYGLELTVFVMG